MLLFLKKQILVHLYRRSSAYLDVPSCLRLAVPRAASLGRAVGTVGAGRRAQRVAARRQRLRALRQRVPQLAPRATPHQHRSSTDLHLFH